ARRRTSFFNVRCYGSRPQAGPVEKTRSVFRQPARYASKRSQGERATLRGRCYKTRFARRARNPAIMSAWIRRHASTLAAAACMCAVTPKIDLGENVHWIEMAFVVTFLVLSLGIHEAAHAWVADKCGDSTGKDLGRITLNPIAHIDPIMSIV